MSWLVGTVQPTRGQPLHEAHDELLATVRAYGDRYTKLRGVKAGLQGAIEIVYTPAGWRPQMHLLTFSDEPIDQREQHWTWTRAASDVRQVPGPTSCDSFPRAGWGAVLRYVFSPPTARRSGIRMRRTVEVEMGPSDTPADLLRAAAWQHELARMDFGHFSSREAFEALARYREVELHERNRRY